MAIKQLHYKDNHYQLKQVGDNIYKLYDDIVIDPIKSDDYNIHDNFLINEGNYFSLVENNTIKHPNTFKLRDNTYDFSKKEDTKPIVVEKTEVKTNHGYNTRDNLQGKNLIINFDSMEHLELTAPILKSGEWVNFVFVLNKPLNDEDDFLHKINELISKNTKDTELGNRCCRVFISVKEEIQQYNDLVLNRKRWFKTILKHKNNEDLQKVISTAIQTGDHDTSYTFVYCNDEDNDFKFTFDKSPSDGVHTIKSFSTVTTTEMKKECFVLIRSIRKFHNEPIYVVCDSSSRKFLRSRCKELDIKDVYYSIELDKKQIDELESSLSSTHLNLNKFHKKIPILKKMSAMRFALNKNDNTFFLDSDIIVASPLDSIYSHEIVLSPHYHFITMRRDHETTSGLYNAGYIFCANKDFPNWWETNYLNDSLFYEQECMNRIPANFNTDIFDRTHNVGFWRRYTKEDLEYIENNVGEIKSYHVHTNPKIDFLDTPCKKDTNRLVSSIREYHRSYKSFLIDIINQEFNCE